MIGKVNRENRWLVYFFAALFVIVVGFLWLNAINATPDIKIENPKPPNPNAYDYYLSAEDSIVDDNKATFALNNRPKGYVVDPSNPDDRYYSPAEKEEIIKKNAAAFKIFREGFNYEYLHPDAWQPYSVFGSFGSFAKFRNFARLMRLESNVYAGKGDYRGAVNTCIDGVRFGNDICRGGSMIDSLVGAAIESITMKDVWDYTDHLSAKDAKLAAKSLEIILNNKYTFAQIYEDEKRYGLKSLLYEVNRKGWRKGYSTRDWDVFGSSPKPFGYENVSLYMRAYTVSKKKIFDNYINYMDLAIENSKKPYSAKSSDVPVPSDPVNEIIAPILEKAWFKYENMNVSERFLLLQLALRAYKLENGKYPDSLSELAPNYLSKVPIDPFGGGKTFKYKRTSDKYILYSLGPDCKDDRGRAITSRTTDKDTKGDIVFGVNMKH